MTWRLKKQEEFITEVLEKKSRNARRRSANPCAPRIARTSKAHARSR